MSLLKKRPAGGAKRRSRLRPYTTLRCPMVGHQASWCRGLCQPIGTQGLCGRPAPHALTGRTQRAIAAYKKRKL